MHAALALAPLTLAAVLVLSGLAKLPDPGATHSMMTLLRLPRALGSRTTARALPWAELAVAVLLLTPWRVSFALGALAAIGLFGVFWLVVARAMTFDPRPTCACFGRVGDHRITARTVARNTLLVVLALLTGWVALEGRTGTGLVAGSTTGDRLWLLMALALAAVAVLVLGGPSADPRPGAAPGAADALGASREPGAPVPSAEGGARDGVPRRAPDGFLVDRDLSTWPLRSLVTERAQLLVLASCWCGSTFGALDRVPAWREALPGIGVQVVHTLAPWDEARVVHLPGVWWDPDGALSSSLAAGRSPAAVLLGTDGQVTAGPVDGLPQIEELVQALAAGPASTADAT